MNNDFEFTVDQTVSAQDEMFKGDPAHYLSVGKSALWNIERAVAWAYPEGRALERILDFPCGHGRVMRYLKAAYPDAELTGCDLNGAGVDFLRESVWGDPGIFGPGAVTDQFASESL